MAHPTLCLVPGMLCDARLFSPQRTALAADRTVVVADITEAASVGAMAEALLARLPQRFDLAGLSLGGMVAMEMVRRAPHRVGRLGLLGTLHKPDSERRRAIRDAQIARIGEEGLEPVFRTDLLPHYLASGHRDAAAIESLLTGMAMDLGPETAARQIAALRDRPDQSATLRGFAGPALVLCGEEDRMCPPRQHDAMAAMLADAERVALPGTGHIATLEAPGAVNAALSRWLARPA